MRFLAVPDAVPALPLLLGALGATALGLALAAVAAAVAAWAVHRRSRARFETLEAELARWRRLEASLAQRTAALAHAVEGIGLVDARGGLREVNRAMAAMYGRDARDLLGRPVSAFLHDDAREAFGQALDRALEEGKAELEARGVRPDGSMFDAEIALVRLGGAGDPRAMCHVFTRDVSERKEAERANRLAFIRRLDMMRLQETDRFKTRFMNAAAHEINTPLTPLRLQLHLLAGDRLGSLNERQRKAVDILERNLGRLSHLVGDMLDVTRLHSGRLSIDPRPVDLDQAIEHIVSTFRGLAEQEGIQLMATVPGPVRIQADPERLEQVLVNLVSNALKFTPKGGQVRVHLEDEGDQVRLLVADTGLGMEPAQIEQLFQPFARLHTDVAPRTIGTGLGLYIAKGIVEGHGGQIGCTSAGRDRGSTFEVLLPVTPRAASGEDMEQKAAPAEAAAGPAPAVEGTAGPGPPVEATSGATAASKAERGAARPPRPAAGAAVERPVEHAVEDAVEDAVARHAVELDAQKV